MWRVVYLRGKLQWTYFHSPIPDSPKLPSSRIRATRVASAKDVWAKVMCVARPCLNVSLLVMNSSIFLSLPPKPVIFQVIKPVHWGPRSSNIERPSLKVVTSNKNKKQTLSTPQRCCAFCYLTYPRDIYGIAEVTWTLKFKLWFLLNIWPWVFC